MVSDSGNTFKKIISENGGRWKTGSIYLVKHINYVISVKGKIEEGILR